MNKQSPFNLIPPILIPILILILILPLHTPLYAQIDTLHLRNGDVMVGEAKSMDKGVITFETSYSDSDFKIEWDKVIGIYSRTSYLITLTNGNRHNGTLRSTDRVNVSILTDEDTIPTTFRDIVYLKSIDAGFWSKFYASLDIGFSKTKANNLDQFSVRSTFGYIAERWSADANYNGLRSTQDDTEDVKRMDGGLTYRFLLPKDYFLLTQISFLSNTEQNIDLRTISKLGAGKYLIHTNYTYWGFQTGLSFNNETFTDETSDRQSAEAFLGTELNMYNREDLSLLTNIVAYPSLTESHRFRVDFTFDLKYDLPLDFYIQLGFTLNYDNQAAEETSNTDYVFQSTFGWEL
jgi:hypothetical protein